MGYKSSMGLKDILLGLGGGDESFDSSDDAPSFNKGGHLQRSLAHQPNHFYHWRGRGGIPGPQMEQPDPSTQGRIIHDWSESHRPIIIARERKGESKD